MLAFVLLLLGGAIALYCLWELRTWLTADANAAEKGAQRLESLVEDLVSTAEATVAMVDDKAEALTALIARADEKLGELRAANLPAAAPAELPAPPPAEPQAVRPAPVQQPEQAAAERAALLGQGVAAPAAPAPHLPEGHQEVYRLADAGIDVTGIARQLNLTKGEVQLILGLRQSKGGGGPRGS